MGYLKPLDRLQARYSMKRSELRLYFLLLREYARTKSLAEGKRIHAILTDRGYDQYAFFGNILIDLYSNFGCILEAESAYRKVHTPDDITYSNMITAYAQNGHLHEAENVFFPIKEKQQKTYRDMIKAYFVHSCVQQARYVFNSMPKREAQHWYVMVEGYAQNGHTQEALEFFRRMPCRDHRTYISMMVVYINSGDLHSARDIFDVVPYKGASTWNEMMIAYAQRGHVQSALGVFKLMDLDGVLPDQTSFVSVFDACANASALLEGKVIEKCLRNTSFLTDSMVLTSTINMYAKCGSLVDAEELFYTVPERDVVLWTTMFTAYSQNGEYSQVLGFFRRMNQDGGAKPNDITFITILSACCHAGERATALQFFRDMKNEYGVLPCGDHYICMVDHLSRTGDLVDAEDLITSMPYEPDPVAWLALLSACKTHHDLQRGIRAALHVVELDPGNSAPYALLAGLSNNKMYIDEVTKFMESRQVSPLYKSF